MKLILPLLLLLASLVAFALPQVELSLPPVSGAFERKHMTDADWNNGTGQRFYRCGELHSDVIKRLLMYGFYTETSLDIPHSRIVGVGFTDDGENFEVRKVKVGREAMSEGGGVL